MHILFLSHYYPPEVNAPASRVSENARQWVKAGHKVTVVTCAPNHPKGAVYPGYRNRLFQRETLDGVEVIRIWTFLAANEGFALRLLNYLSYPLSLLLNLFRIPKANVVVSTSPQFFCGLAGILIKRRRRPWVLEIRDLWPESIVAVGAMKRGMAIRTLEAIERFAYRSADALVSVTDSFVPHLHATRHGKGPVVVIKNGVDLDFFSGAKAAEATALRREFSLQGKFVAAYVGTHGMAHGLDTVLAAAELLRGEQDIAFLLVGDGSERERLAREAEERRLTNVILVGQRPKSDMPAIWELTDASLVLLRRLDTFKSVLPSKMFEAMAMRKPMILGVEGEARALMDEAGAGIGILPEDATGLAAAVCTLARDPARAGRLGESGRAFVEQSFDRRDLALRYLSFLEGVIAERRRA
jgi:glycosyltransferase involved in cell wall biosynthesis